MELQADRRETGGQRVDDQGLGGQSHPYKRVEQIGDKRTRIGEDSPLFKNGKSRDANGYVTLTSKIWGENQGRREHQVIAEEMLGRKLESHEIVHHINGDKADNRPENLSIETRQSHNRKHGKGKLLTCINCGTDKWYSPSGIKKLKCGTEGYLCKPCTGGRNHTLICKLCNGEFIGGLNARYCENCTTKNASRN